MRMQNQALVQAFVKLVTSARKHDPRLQKLFDKLVPKKASELTFWRRYCAHAHALLNLLLFPAEDAPTYVSFTETDEEITLVQDTLHHACIMTTRMHELKFLKTSPRGAVPRLHHQHSGIQILNRFFRHRHRHIA